MPHIRWCQHQPTEHTQCEARNCRSYAEYHVDNLGYSTLNKCGHVNVCGYHTVTRAKIAGVKSDVKEMPIEDVERILDAARQIVGSNMFSTQDVSKKVEGDVALAMYWARQRNFVRYEKSGRTYVHWFNN